MSEDTFSPGYVESISSTKRKSKEDLRINELIPGEIQNYIGEGGIKTLLNKYYEFMNMDEFTYQTTETFNDIILLNKAVFRYPDPDGNGNSFFTDDDGSNSTLVLSKAGEDDVTINLIPSNVAISNGNDLPGSLAKSTSAIGKTITIKGLGSYNGWNARLTTLIRNWVGPGPSYILNALEDAMDIDKNLDQDGQLSQDYLEMMQKEIAASIPADLQANKSVLYKRIIDFYKVRGSDDSIETFFRLFFNEEVEVEKPYDNTLIPSAGDWDPSINQFTSTKGFISEKDIRIHDSFRYQKYSYLIKSGRNVDDWKDTFNKLVHPAGFIFFGEILILLKLTRDTFGDNVKPITIQTKNPETGLLVNQTLNVYGNQRGPGFNNRVTLSSMPGQQPGVIGAEDLPLLIEMFISMFTPNPEALANRRAVLSPVISNGAISSITVVQGGSGYISQSAPVITITGDGNGASATANLNSDGVIESLNVTGGSGYTTADISVSEPKDASNNITTTKIGKINIFNRIKRSYRQPPIISIGAPTAVDSDGNLLSSNVQAIANFVMDSTSLDFIKVTNGGSGYTSIPTVTVSGNATARAIVQNTKVTGIEVISKGSGYTALPTITISGGGGSNATAEGYLTPTTINSINISNAGNGYMLNPAISILSRSIDEHRAKDTQMILKIMLNHLSETTNNYFNSKGNRFGNTSYTYNSNLTIEQIGTQIIQNNYKNSINSYNTNSFVTLD